MKKRSLLIVFTFFTTIIFGQTKTNWSPEQCLKLKNISGVVPSPDGSKVLYTVREAVMTDDRSEYVNQVFLCDADGSNTIQLTKGDRILRILNGVPTVNGSHLLLQEMEKIIYTFFLLVVVKLKK